MLRRLALASLIGIVVVPISAAAEPPTPGPSPSPRPGPVPSPVLKPWAERAKDALDARVKANLALCKTLSGPTGAGKVDAFVAPSGQISTATVAVPFKGTGKGDCVLGLVSTTVLPPTGESAPREINYGFVMP